MLYYQVLLPECRPKSLAVDELSQEPALEDLVRISSLKSIIYYSYFIFLLMREVYQNAFSFCPQTWKPTLEDYDLIMFIGAAR